MWERPRKQQSMLSAGIDVGTSTTKMIVSRFQLMNVAGATHVPRIEIVETEILYQSPIYRTPLLDASTIDVAKVEALVRNEYKKAGVAPEEIETGAVIITGETATKKNAREMVTHLSEHAGDFLVATAGPDLEGMIAAKGSGAFDESAKSYAPIANVDIGGGTANIAVYHQKKLLGTCTMHVGGRLIEFENNVIHSISPPIQKLLAKKQWALQVGDPSDHPVVSKVIQELSAALFRILAKRPSEEDEVLVLGHLPNWSRAVETVMFSGGVAECMYRYEEQGASPAQYDDIGQQLAEEIMQQKLDSEFHWLEPKETVRATVLGAGTHTTEISGATIQVQADELPLKNLPVYEFDFKQDFERRLPEMEQAIGQALDLYDAYREGQNFALYLSSLPYMKFHSIQQLAEHVMKVMNKRADPSLPIVLVLETDHAKVLGQTLHAMQVKQSIICIDQIKVEHGDYLDIGRTLASDTVPVVIKTLTFHS